ncbi:hypothetical protein [Flammeovirga sp. EKP202]|uniref:hypothetical protein n=1 Tax=Flammeovirga sp. EKP202 TaxID=2770592 RepID=UPI00165F9B88|nr:hypothetical protein [Flammeovirga sp. EKP202]MBD0400474.1 hypothetical protein [Flammeovirga sp. EKP202]
MIDDENADELELGPVEHVFHDAIEVEVEDSLTQLAIDVKILGWLKDDRSSYYLHYKFSRRDGGVVYSDETIPYDDIQIKDDILTESLFFDELDSLTEYCLELSSTYRDEVTKIDTYFFFTKGDTITKEME